MAENEIVLLEQYSRTQDAVAFRELVEQHQDMVFAACRPPLAPAQAVAASAAAESSPPSIRDIHCRGRRSRGLPGIGGSSGLCPSPCSHGESGR